MYTLAINTASSHTSLILAKGKEVIEDRTWPSQNDEAEKIMPRIKEMLGGRSFDQITRILVLRGPGSFTGLRVGITVANTIAYLVGAKLFQISTFEYWHQLTDLPVLIFAGKKSVYLSEGPDDYQIVELDQLNDELKKRQITKVTGDISEAQKAILEVEFIETEGGLQDILDQGEEVPVVQPLYVRNPGIHMSQKNTPVGEIF